MLIWQISGLVLAVAGIAALYGAWRAKRRSWPLVTVGWLLVLGAIHAWGRTSGIDKGPALGIIVVVLAGLVALAFLAATGPVKTVRAAKPVSAGLSARAGIGGERLAAALAILAIVLVGLAVSIAACTALFMGNRALGMEHTANLTLTMFSFPILWGALATYIGYAESPAARAKALATVAAASGCVLFLTMQGA